MLKITIDYGDERPPTTLEQQTTQTKADVLRQFLHVLSVAEEAAFWEAIADWR